MEKHYNVSSNNMEEKNGVQRRRDDFLDSWSDMSDCESDYGPSSYDIYLGDNADGYVKVPRLNSSPATGGHKITAQEESMLDSLEINDCSGLSSWQTLDASAFASLPACAHGDLLLYPSMPTPPVSLPSNGYLSSFQSTSSSWTNERTPVTQNHESSSQTTWDSDQADNTCIKTKFMTAWNNMKHGWMVRTKTSFSYNHPICLLGNIYSSTEKEREDWRKDQERGRLVVTAMEKFKRDFTSRIWFTYRQDFTPLPNSSITADVGWGCMLRSGQMIVAQALVMHFLGREWRWYPKQTKNDVMFHQKIVGFFSDLPNIEAPFSVHALVSIGSNLGKKPGDWYGPASVAHVLREAMELVPKANPLLGQMCLYVAPDCTVYRQDVLDLCMNEQCKTSSAEGTSEKSSSNKKRSNHWKAVIILIPVRLGGESLNQVYIPAIQTILAHDMCIGIIGGRPKHSVYFVGFQDEKLIYIDPHFCQDAVDMSETEFPLQSFHCMSPRKMSYTKMDPSCTVGFYCKSRADFENFCLEIPQIAAPKSKGQYPMFVLAEGKSSDVSCGSSDRAGEKVRVRHYDKKGNVKQLSKDSDDFIFL